MAKPYESLGRLGLADYLTELQAELNKARLQYDAEDLGFSVDGFTLELDVMFTMERSAHLPAKAKPQFWVQGLAAQNETETTKSATPSVQRLIVRMSPGPRDQSMEDPDEIQATTPLPAQT